MNTAHRRWFVEPRRSPQPVKEGRYSDHHEKGRQEDADRGNQTTQSSMQQVTNKRGGNHNRAGGHLPQDDAVHEGWRVHPVTDIHDLVQHQRYRGEPPSESCQIDAEEQHSQAEETTVKNKQQ